MLAPRTLGGSNTGLCSVGTHPARVGGGGFRGLTRRNVWCSCHISLGPGHSDTVAPPHPRSPRLVGQGP